MSLHTAVLLSGVLLVGSGLCSSVYENIYFPRIPHEEVVDYWKDIYANFDPGKVKHTCTKLHSGATGMYNSVKYFTDWTSTSTIMTPPTIVAIPENPYKPFILDINYADFSGVLDIPNGYPVAPCYVVPPYKPLVYTVLQSNTNVTVLAFRENFGDGNEGASDSCKECEKFDMSLLKKCQVVGPPTSYDLPVHPFFLTSGQKLDKNDVTMYLILTVERLPRLVEIAERWGGPISAAVDITNTSQVPLVIKTWMKNECMRKYVDIHLVYDDEYPIVELTDRPFPINYLRNVALKNTRTELVFYVEVDFVPSKDLKDEILKHKELMLKEKKSVFIVPCLTSKVGTTADEIPETKEQLEKEVGPGKKFNTFSSKTLDAFDIDYWFKQDKVYTMTVGREYEPYYIGHRDYPLFDEIFYGCGFDKIPHMFEMRSLGYTIRVLPRGVIIHLDSDVLGGKSWCKGWRKVPRRYIKRGMFFHRVNHTPGLYQNTHQVPWFKDHYEGTDVKIGRTVYDNNYATGEEIYKTFIADKKRMNAMRAQIVVLWVVLVIVVLTSFTIISTIYRKKVAAAAFKNN